jgi:hypothetical protein
VELGFNTPESFAGWTPNDQPPDTIGYPLDIHHCTCKEHAT